MDELKELSYKLAKANSEIYDLNTRLSNLERQVKALMKLEEDKWRYIKNE